MKIRYWGHSCFEFTNSCGVRLITDPYTGVGYELPDGLSAEIVTVSHGHFDHNFTQAVQTENVLNTTGAHCVQGIEIYGVESAHDPKHGALRGKNIIFKFVMDGLTVCHMGDIGEEVTDSLVEKIGKVDVLLIPVGGTYTIDAQGAKAYMDKLAPKTVIPMHYKPADGRLDITGIQPFLSIIGKTYASIPNGETQVNVNTQGVLYMERIRK